MNLGNISHSNFPFNHWEFSNCLEKNAMDEISYSTIPNGKRAYDGTRAADYTGEGIDGKLRLFINKENHENFPYLTKLINSLQSKKLVDKIKSTNGPISSL